MAVGINCFGRTSMLMELRFYFSLSLGDMSCGDILYLPLIIPFMYTIFVVVVVSRFALHWCRTCEFGSMVRTICCSMSFCVTNQKKRGKGFVVVVAAARSDSFIQFVFSEAEWCKIMANSLQSLNVYVKRISDVRATQICMHLPCTERVYYGRMKLFLLHTCQNRVHLNYMHMWTMKMISKPSISSI